MNRIFVRSDFAERDEYRLVSMDDAWVKAFRELPHGAPSSQKRRRSSGSDADVSVVCIMKGEEQLYLHDAVTTRSVRRVEYSNVMMLAARRLNAVGRTALKNTATAATAAAASGGSAAEPPPPLPPVRECNDSVAIASLTRMFDSHAAPPQLNLLAALADSHVGIDELESGGTEEKAPRGHTFAQLARRFSSSPKELADHLQLLGAVVHNGRVRLLQPALRHEALTAALTYFDAAEPTELTWTAVRRHLCPSVYPAVVLRSLEAVYGGAREKHGDSSAAADDDEAVVGLAGVLNVPVVLLGLAAGIFDTDAAVAQRSLGGGAVARGLPLETFLEKWWNSIPSALFGTAGVPRRSAADAAEHFLARLRGYAVVEPRLGKNTSTSGGVRGGDGRLQGTLWWLPRDLLSNDFATRLAALFEVCPQRWSQQDLKAYMEPLLAPDQNFQHIIVRFVREYRIPGQVVQYAPLT